MSVSYTSTPPIRLHGVVLTKITGTTLPLLSHYSSTQTTLSPTR